MNAFNSVVRPILEYASQVWAPYNTALIKDLDMVQRRAIRWAYRLSKMDSVTDTMQKHNITSLFDRRSELDIQFLRRVEFGDVGVDLADYLTFNTTYNTRHRTINPHLTVNSFKYSYYNRMREHVVVQNF